MTRKTETLNQIRITKIVILTITKKTTILLFNVFFFDN